MNTILLLKAHIKAHTRRLANGKVVQVMAHSDKRGGADKQAGQMSLFSPGAGKPMGPNRYADKHPVLDTPDLFSGETGREAAGAGPGEAVTTKPAAGAVTDTPEFKAWFGDSKVVGADGKPLVVYHGTTADFDAFQENSRGIHFVSPSASWVSKFLKTDDGETAEGANVLPVYVKAENPFDYENKQHVNALARAASIGASGVNQIKKGSWARLEDRTTLAAIKRLGFDGLYVNEDGIKNLGVFTPHQIKSATGNSGAFDPKSADITKALTAGVRLLLKSHVAAYTKKDGTFVAAHEDKRTAHQDQHPTKLDAFVSALPDDAKGFGDLIRQKISAHAQDFSEDPGKLNKLLSRQEKGPMPGYAAAAKYAKEFYFGSAQAPSVKLPKSIDVDGVKRPTKNSAGENIAGSPDAVANFWRWFGGSKMVGKGGTPLVVYHGSNSDFTEFDSSRLGSNTESSDATIGFHFAGSESDADLYAEMAAKNGGEATVRAFYLKLENPLIVGTSSKEGNAGSRFQEFIDDKFAAEKFAMKNGHDGIVYLHGTNVDSGYTAIAFRSDQIKSASDNSGAFDPKSNNVTKSLAPTMRLLLKAHVRAHIRHLPGGRMCAGLRMPRQRKR